MAFLRKKSFWYATIALLVFITDIWVYFYLKDRYHMQSSESIAGTSDSKSSPKSPDQLTQENLTISNPIIRLKSKAISTNPEMDLKNIKERAQKLSNTEIEMLVNETVNRQTPPDKRFESVFLLSHNDHIPLVLKKIVESPLPDSITPQEQDFEHILRAQAIEGIEKGREKPFSKKIIQDLILKTDNSFLLDRLHRAKNSLEGVNGSSEVQDNKQLEKLVEN